MTTIPSLGQWGPISDTIEGALADHAGRIADVESRSGTSVAGSVATFADLPTSPRDGQSYVVRDEVALYTWNGTAWAPPVPMQGTATTAAVAAAAASPAVWAALTRGGERPVGQGEQVIDALDPRYGVTANGVTDDTAGLNAAANAARAGRTNGRQGHALLLPADRNVYINGTVDLRHIIDVRLEAKIIVGPNGLLVLGHTAVARPGQRIHLRNALHASGGQSNVCARFVGMKQGEVTIGTCSSVELLADDTGTAADKSANGSFAYNTFVMGWVGTLHLRGVGDTAWINQNTFVGGTYVTIRLSGDYSHNENTWMKPCVEGGLIDVQRGERNRWVDARCEAGTQITFGPLTVRNIVEDSYVSNLNTRESGAAVVTDQGVDNVVVGVPDLFLRADTLARLDADTIAFNAGACEYAGAGIAPGLDRIRARANFHYVLDTGVVPLREDVAALPSSERYAAGWRVRRFEITSDVAVWRPYVTLYDATGAVVTNGGLAGAWIYTTADGWEEAYLGGDVRHARLTVTSPTATHIRIRIRTWTTNPFRWLQLNAFSPLPSSPSGLEMFRRALRRPLYQATAPTQGLAHPGTVVQGPSGSWRAVARVETTATAGAASGATVVTVATAAGVAIGDVIGVVLSTGLTHWTTVASVSGSTVTLTAGLPASVSSGAKVGTTRWA